MTFDGATPRRIQRTRAKGWTKPPGAVYVGRGTRWGNPWRIAHGPNGGWNLHTPTPNTDPIWYPDRESAARAAVAAYGDHLARHPELVDQAREQLAGLDLMCWCRTGQPCHADVLLEAANPQEAHGPRNR